MSAPQSKVATPQGQISKPPSKSTIKKQQAESNKAAGVKHTEAFCTKCRVKRAIKNPALGKTKNNRNMLTGSCGQCGGSVHLFVSKDYAL